MFSAGSINVLTAEDFTVILNGSPEIEVDVLKAHTTGSFSTSINLIIYVIRIVTGGDSAFANNFWRAVEKMSTADRARLLAFWTGSACVPSDLSSWRLDLRIRGSVSAHLPVAATCMNRLTLPK